MPVLVLSFRCMAGFRIVLGAVGGLLGVVVASLDFSRHPADAVILLLISVGFFSGMWRRDRLEMLDVVAGILILLATAEVAGFWPAQP